MTTEQRQQAEEFQAFETLQPGTLLKQKREQLGLSQREIADRLRLRLTIIQSIENNQYELGQVDTFTKGYLRSYAKAVGIPQDDVLKLFVPSEPSESPEQKLQSFSKQTSREKHDTRIMVLTVGIFAVIIGISSVWWIQNKDSDVLVSTEFSSQQQESNISLTEDQPVPVLKQASSTTNEIAVAVTSEQEDVSLASLETSDATSTDVKNTETASTVVETNATSNTDSSIQSTEAVVAASNTPGDISNPEQTERDTSSIEDTAATNQPVAKAIANLIEMNFQDDCWIEVKDANGKTLATGVKTAGATLELQGALPYKVVLGAPQNVSMTFASEPVDLSGYTSGKVARFTLR